MAALATGDWLLLAVAASVLAPFLLAARGDLPDWLSVDGPLTTVRWARGGDALDAVTRPARAWRALWTAGIVVALAVAAVVLAVLVAAAAATLLEPALGRVATPQSVLSAPGIDGFLPLAVAPAVAVALAVALLGHETGHALACRTDGIDVSAVGAVLVGVLPVGAFVEHDPESLDDADASARARMLAAGVTANFLVAAVALALAAGPIAAAISPVSGVAVGGVVAGGPAADAGIQPGDVIQRVDGVPVANRSELDAAIDDQSRVVSAQLATGDVVHVRRALLVAKIAPGLRVDIQPNTRILSVNGTEVDTVAGFRAAVRNRTVATLATTNGTYTLPVGVAVSRVARSGALAAAGVPANANVTILAVDGERTLTPDDLESVLEANEVGDTVPVRAVVDGTVRTYRVTLRAGVEGSPKLGVFYRVGTSGLVLADFGVEAYPADEYLDAFALRGSFEAGSVFDRVAGFLLLPVAGAVGMAPYDFPGFTGHVKNFYTVSGPLAALGDWAFVVPTLLFWVVWVNLNVGLFNCVPALPLDGGRLVHAAATGVRDRWLSERDVLPEAVTLAATAVVVASLAVTLLALAV
ncbi:MAG: site-2 protease family protein [Halobacterium sp.]